MLWDKSHELGARPTYSNGRITRTANETSGVRTLSLPHSFHRSLYPLLVTDLSIRTRLHCRYSETFRGTNREKSATLKTQPEGPITLHNRMVNPHFAVHFSREILR